MVRVFGHYIPRAFITLLCVEVVILVAAFYFGVAIRSSQGTDLTLIEMSTPLFPKSLIYALVMCGAMTVMGLYTRDLRDGNWGLIIRVTASLVAGLLVLVLFFYLFPGLFVGRGALAWALVVSAILIVAVRLIFLNSLDISLMKKRILVLGAGGRAATVSRMLRRKEERRGISIIGYVQLSQDHPVVTDHVIEHTRPLREIVEQYGIDTLVIAVDDRRKSFPIHELVDCRMHGIEVLDLMSFVERHCRKILLSGLHPSWLVFSDGFRTGTLRDIEKRIFDIGVSLLLLLLTWPLMLGTMLAILFESGGRGPVLYRQQRVGEHGDVFNVLKFRSMTVNAESNGAQWASKDDVRVTRVGRIIRKYRIDELPQLINVLKGEMSFVGPRPERPEFVAELAEKIPYYNDRHRVRPGITGWAQICYPYGASERDAEEKLQYDLYYVKNYTIFLDLIILLQTAQTIIWGRGAR